ncbi:MAG: carboxylesterase family protein, partial [Parafilimonas sp.]
SSIETLRKIPADSLQKLSGSFAASTVIDGYVLPKDVYSIFKNDEQNDVAVLTGWNADDGFPSGNIPDAKKYAADAKEKYGALANEYLQAFPGNTTDEISTSLFALNRDNLFAWQAYTWAKLQTTKGHHNVYVYLFNRTAPGEEKYGAFHSSEIPFALDNLHTWNLEWTDADKKLADIMSDYWVNFAKTGNPNGASLPEWKLFSVAENKVMNLNIDEQSMQPISVKNQFDFLDKYQSYLRAKKK